MRGHRSPLCLGETAIGTNAPEEVAAHRPGTGRARLRPGSKARAEVYRVRLSGGRNWRTGRLRKLLAGRRVGRAWRRKLRARRLGSTDQPTGRSHAVEGPLFVRGIKTPRQARPPKPDLLLIGRVAIASPVLTVGASACLHASQNLHFPIDRRPDR
jgi:hypothetical protein